MKKLLCGNLKMHCDKDKLRYLSNLFRNEYDDIELIYAVPFTHLTHSKKCFPSFISIAAQDCSKYVKGAHTGEISAKMLVELGIKHIIIGHSERRCIFDSNEDVAEKVVNALSENMNVIVCVGEDIEQRENGETLEVVCKQVECVFERMKSGEFKHIDVAYEPVWSIGTGIVPTSSDITDVVAFIKDMMLSYGIIGRVVYGGSVDVTNVCTLCDIEILNGFLVGKSSMNEGFVKIADCLHKKD